MYVPATSWGSEWQVLALMVGAAALFLFQAQSVSRRRIVAAVALIVVAIGCKVLADGDIYILDPCAAFVRYSWEWWLYGCWSLPG